MPTHPNPYRQGLAKTSTGKIPKHLLRARIGSAGAIG